MTIVYNPFTDNLDYKGVSGSAGITSIIATYPVIANTVGGVTTISIAVQYVKVAANYLVSTLDRIVGVSNTAAARTISLPNPASGGLVAGQWWTIKDESILASVNNITINVVGAVALIDGAATAVINTNGGSLDIYFDGTNYFLK